MIAAILQFLASFFSSIFIGPKVEAEIAKEENVNAQADLSKAVKAVDARDSAERTSDDELRKLEVGDPNNRDN